MATTADRIQEGMDIRGYKQVDLVRMTGISKGALSSYLSGRYVPKQNNTYLIAKALDVNEAWLMGSDVPMERNPKKTNLDKIKDQLVDLPENTVTIPVLGDVAAGTPIFASENYIDYVEVSADLAKNDTLFGLRVKGDSMSPRISEGDTLIVRQQDDAESGDIVVVLINGDSATCKRLMKYAEGISLISLNPAYEPMMFTNKEIKEKPVKILGKVIEGRQKY